MTGRLNWLVPALMLALAAAPAKGQTYATPIFSGGGLGRVAAAGTVPTLFQIDATSGAVTVISGSAVRTSSGAANVVVTLSCGNQAACNTTNPIITLGSSGTPTNAAGALDNFTVADGTATVGFGPLGTDPIIFTLDPIGQNQTKSFTIGYTFPINAGGPTGLSTSGYTLTLFTLSGGLAIVSGSGTATATVSRGISLTKNSDLAFGRIIRPNAGSGTVTVSTAGARSLTGTGSFGFAAPAPTAASFGITGEGGQSVTVSVPSSFVMTRAGSPNITVNTTATGSGAQTLGGTLGSTGTLAVSVGGSFTINSATPTGGYSGSFLVSVQYN